MKQKEVVTVELYDNESNSFKKSEYVVISRDEYHSLTKRSLACEIVYSDATEPFIIPIKVSGLRRTARVNTLLIYTLKQGNGSKSTHEFIGEISNKEFLKIAQAVSLNFNFPF
ncbi:type II toxin-antitoxin system PemK/MazF family toxin [Aerococcaceae bacterium WGS1372]